MSVILKDSSNSTVYTFPSGVELIDEPFFKRLDSEPRAYQHGGVIVSDEKVATRMVSLHGIFNKASQALMETELNSMKKACYTEDLRLYATQNSNDYYNVECLNFDHNFLGMLTVVEISVDFQCADPLRYYKDLTTDTHYLSKALSLDGNGYASIPDANQKGLDMGYSDFMIGIRIKLNKTIPNQTNISPSIYHKFGDVVGYYFRIIKSIGTVKFGIGDGSSTKYADFVASSLNDLSPHYLMFVADKSSSTGLKIFLDGSEVSYTTQQDPTSIGNIDNSWEFHIGCNNAKSEKIEAQFDEAEVWNFGYGGLPPDYAAYIAWRHTHPHAPLSEYNSGAWNGYADADRTEKIPDGGLENWTDDTPDDWLEVGESAGVRDILEEGVEIHGGSHAAKLEATLNDGTIFNISDYLTLVANKYFELSGWFYFASRTAGKRVLRLWNATDGSVVNLESTTLDGSYAWYGGVGKPTIVNSSVYCIFDLETTAGIVYFDDISIKRVGLVAHWKLNGDYTDETSNGNDLTAGGTGNSFILISLPDDIVINDGDIECFPTISFTAGGAITKVKVQNTEDGGKYFEYTGSIASGKKLVVDTKQGTVEYDGADSINNFTGSFIKLISGTNTITITITGTAGDSECEFSFRKRWL